MKLRNGRPPDAIDRELADIHRIWGDDTRIDITEDDCGHAVITVAVRSGNDQQGRPLGYIRVDTRTVTA
jgi:hypothetical protein